MNDFKMCKCGICENDCEYHKPELPVGYTTTTTKLFELLKQMYPIKPFFAVEEEFPPTLSFEEQ